MRRRIYSIVEVSKGNDWLSAIYDVFMLVVIVASIVPLAFFKQEYQILNIIDKFAAYIFVVDYVLRLFTADYKLGKGKRSFVIYPFTAMAIIDLISILPSFLAVSSGFRLFKLVRLFKTLKLFRLFKAARYSKNVMILANVFKQKKDVLTIICGIAVMYILVSALVIVTVEPESFDSFFDAVYWSCVSLTTVGYGDIYPVTVAGRIVTMISSFVGIAIVALPAGVLTSGFMEELGKKE